MNVFKDGFEDSTIWVLCRELSAFCRPRHRGTIWLLYLRAVNVGTVHNVVTTTPYNYPPILLTLVSRSAKQKPGGVAKVQEHL